MLIGIESGQDGIVEDRSGLGVRGNDLRGADYLPGWEGAGDRFAQHMRFVTDEVLPYAEREFSITQDRTRRGVDGFSNGAVFALWAGVMAPESFGVAIARSAGYDREMPAQDMLAQLAHTRFFISAGLYESSFWRASKHWADTLRPHAQSVVFTAPAGGHAPDQGALMLVQYLREAFPARGGARLAGFRTRAVRGRC
ncbi:MAG: alpha/beta hydrolase-fold protein [Terricaulis sp.]|nr:alpha/beta hydrolase-fold protein [Terricaulis sp.]